MRWRRGQSLAVGAVFACLFVLTGLGGAPVRASYISTVLSDNPVGYWRLNETSGTLAADSATAAAPSPQNGPQNGSWMGTATQGAAGPRPVSFNGFEADNVAAAFDAVDERVAVPDDGSFNFSATGKFSLEAWVKAPSTQVSGAAIITKGTGGGGEQYCLDVSTGKYRFYGWNGAGTPTVVSTSIAPDNTWQYLVAVFDSSQAIMKLYVNGVQAGSASPPSTLVNNSHDVTIGARQAASASYDLYFNGLIDEAAIYNYALTPAQIQSHYNAGVTPEPATLSLLAIGGLLALRRRTTRR